MRILIAEDDPLLAQSLTQALREAGYATDGVTDGAAADAALAAQQFDLLVLDIGLPGLDGFQVLSRLRARGAAMPVMILTALDAVENRVRGLDLGADDYLVKPFALSEFEARVRALARRARGAAGAVVRHGDLEFDAAAKSARASGKPLDLSARELALLEIFLTRAGRVVGKEQIIDLLCQWGEEVSANAVEVYVHRLRKKLEAARLEIVTVRGLGYCLEKPAADG
ncbi:MAG: response regulator transcription factor [Betaproteobacteria bacterium]|nr:response regulator transcription factor [Betaproteobacteria bacterium]